VASEGADVSTVLESHRELHYCSAPGALFGNDAEGQAVSSEESNSRDIAWGPWIIVAVGGLLLFLGVGRFVIQHRFGFSDALHCCMALVPAGLLLLIFDYVLHHAKVVAIFLFLAAGAMLFSSPVFDVALGLSLMGAVAGPALSDRKSENRLRRSTKAQGNETNKTAP
jgi:hypothetical protein